MRILLFDWIAEGHHGGYARAVADALAPHLSVTVAAPAPLAGTFGGSTEFVGVESQRPEPDLGARLEPQLRDIAWEERELARRVVGDVRPDFFFHLYADPIVQSLGGGAHVQVPSIACIFKPFAHYPRAYGVSLSPRERQRALRFEFRVAAWRLRRTARAIFTLDPVAARVWNRRPGAPSFWFPEPPVDHVPEPSKRSERHGCVLFGFLERRKGLDRLAAAVSDLQDPPAITVAGAVRRGFEVEVESSIAQMRAAGAEVARERGVRSDAGLRLLARARCVVLPYRKHVGMSRILLEAAACGTPVVADNYGLLGDLVRRHGLGLTVDADDPSALGAALHELCSDPSAGAQYAPALERFAARFSPASFSAALWNPIQRALVQNGR